MRFVRGTSAVGTNGFRIDLVTGSIPDGGRFGALVHAVEDYQRCSRITGHDGQRTFADTVRHPDIEFVGWWPEHHQSIAGLGFLVCAAKDTNSN